ncbi:MAG: flavin-containing monooxygenase [Oligoflexales bacterium]
MTLRNEAKIAIIGAGASGLPLCKELYEHQLDFVCYEASDRVGGNWVFKNNNNMSAAYRSLHINTSRKKMEYADYPMPKSLPDFPHHSQIAEYLENYVNYFGFREKIRFNTKVKNAKKQSNGRWRLETSEGEVKFYDLLVVANGHHWNPKFPETEAKGNFSGTKIHSHQYIDPEEPMSCKGKNIVIVGLGNSAVDIACELSQKALGNKVFLSVRRPTHILPKHIFGMPIDNFLRHPAAKPKLIEYLLPEFIVNKIVLPSFSKILDLLIGKPEIFGLKSPSHPLGHTHPTISSEIHTRLISGDIIPKSSIKRFAENMVFFADGTCEKVDQIIYATGYKISFPFFDDDFLDFKDNDLALYQRMLHPDHRNLLFIGLVQPLCSILPIAEIQAKWMAYYLSGLYQAPKHMQMLEASQELHQSMKNKYVTSKRHTIQIDCMAYSRALNKDLKQGFKRAKKAGFIKPYGQSEPDITRPRQASNLYHGPEGEAMP